MTSLEEVFLKSNEQLHDEKAKGEGGNVVKANDGLENIKKKVKANDVADNVEENEVPHDTMNLVGKGTLC